MPQEPPIKTSTHGSLGATPNVEVSNKTQKREVQLKGIQASIILTLKDKDNNPVKQTELPAHSFVLNFMRLLWAVFKASSITAKNTAGANVTAQLTRIRQHIRYEIEYHITEYYRESAGFHAWASKEDDSHGILIGSGTTSVSPDDYALASKIPNGLETGKMLYLSGEVSDTYVVGNEAHLFIKRSFINHSGATIYVRELGVAVRQFSPQADILIIRDVIIEQEVPNDYTLDVTYTIEVSI